MSSPPSGPRLSQTSFVVLGLIEQAEPATPYDLKQLAALSTSNFWALPHTQLYTECERLAAEGAAERDRASTPAAGGAATASPEAGGGPWPAGGPSRRESCTSSVTRGC